MGDRQRLEAIVAVVCKYLPPNGISREEAMSQIIALVDPLPEQPQQAPVGMTCKVWTHGCALFDGIDLPNETLLYTAPPSKPEKEKESALRDADPRLLLGRSNNFTKETENRLCDIERRLAAIETQHVPPSKPWVSLTEEESSDTYNCHYNEYVSNDIGIVDFIVIARAIEAKLKEKNNG